MTAQKLEVLDFIIEVLKDHERKLSELASRLEDMLTIYELFVKETTE